MGAYAYPGAQADLDTYRNTFSLGQYIVPQYDQNGIPLNFASPTVSYDPGWGAEEMLDLQSLGQRHMPWM